MLCIVTIVGLDAAYYTTSSQQIAARERLERTVAVSRALDRVQALMVDAETGVRGYALVGRESMLEPYRMARAQYEAALDEAARLTDGDALQHQAVERLRGLVAAKWAVLDATVHSVNERPEAGAEIEASTSKEAGKVAMDAIRALVESMQAHESALHDALLAQFQQTVIFAQMLVIGTSVFALFAVAALYGVMGRFFALRQRWEAQLRASEERYRILTEVAPQIVWRTDQRGDMTFCNQEWIEYTGVSLEETIRRGAADVVHPDDRETVRNAWREAIAKGSFFDTEVRLRRADGVYRWHISRARPLRDDQGTVVAWFGAATDIDDRVQIGIAMDRFTTTLSEQVATRTAELEERSGQLRALNQNMIRATESERSRLARELHDELGAHLSVAVMDLTMMARGLEKSGQSEIAALNLRVIQTLKDTAQISRRIISDLRPVMIRELGLANALDSYCSQLESTTSLRFERNFPETLPALVEEAGIAVFRIVQESISNIVKYADAKTVRVSLAVKADFLELRIEDDGRGMALEALKKRGTHGLIGVRERAEGFGGSLLITGGLNGRGTGLIVTFALTTATGADEASDAASTHNR